MAQQYEALRYANVQWLEVASVDRLLGGLMLAESGRLSVLTLDRSSVGVLVANVTSADSAHLGALAGFLGGMPQSTTWRRAIQLGIL